MSQTQVTITKDGRVAEVGPSSVRVWLDKGWKLVEETDTSEAPAEDGEASEVQTDDGAPASEATEPVPDPVQHPQVRQPSRTAAPPTEPGQEASNG